MRPPRRGARPVAWALAVLLAAAVLGSRPLPESRRAERRPLAPPPRPTERKFVIPPPAPAVRKPATGRASHAPARVATRTATAVATIVPRTSPESAPTRAENGATWMTADDLARLLGATKFWTAETRKFVLRVATHRLQLTVDNPFVLVDDATVRLAAPVRSRAGELQVPVELLRFLPRDVSVPRLVYDPGRRTVFQVPAAGVVEAPGIGASESGTRVVFPVDDVRGVVVASRSRAHFRVRFPGFFVGVLPDTVRGPSLVRSIRTIPSVVGTAFELAIAPAATGFRLIESPGEGEVQLVIASSAGADVEPFAPEGAPGPRPLRVIVLDPGHGGADPGLTVEGMAEKKLALDLALKLKAEIERRLGARVVLTREDDRAMTVEERAERANRARADLVLSLHFDGYPSATPRGVTAYCPPATFGDSGRDDARVAALEVLPWRDVATRHAVRSRELADDILSSLELRALGPTRLRELLPYPLLGVNAPGLMLECGTLTSAADRARLARPEGLAELATGIADGVAAYRGHE